MIYSSVILFQSLFPFYISLVFFNFQGTPLVIGVIYDEGDTCKRILVALVLKHVLFEGTFSMDI